MNLPDAVNAFKALGEPLRLRLICLLAAAGQELAIVNASMRWKNRNPTFRATSKS